jgi:hypothetical protein
MAKISAVDPAVVNPVKSLSIFSLFSAPKGRQPVEPTYCKYFNTASVRDRT